MALSIELETSTHMHPSPPQRPPCTPGGYQCRSLPVQRAAAFLRIDKKSLTVATSLPIPLLDHANNGSSRRTLSPELPQLWACAGLGASRRTQHITLLLGLGSQSARVGQVGGKGGTSARLAAAQSSPSNPSKERAGSPGRQARIVQSFGFLSFIFRERKVNQTAQE